MLSLDPHHHHRKSVKDAAESARQAVAKTITKESIAAERAKEAHGLSLKIQVARTLIAVAFTVGGLRTIQTGVWPSAAGLGGARAATVRLGFVCACCCRGVRVNSRHRGFVLHPQVPAGSTGS